MVNEQPSKIYEEDLYAEEEDYNNENARLQSLAQGVLRGEYGYGKARRDKLGKDHFKVMAIVKAIRLQNGTKTESPLDENYQEVSEEELAEEPQLVPEHESTEGYVEEENKA